MGKNLRQLLCCCCCCSSSGAVESSAAPLLNSAVSSKESTPGREGDLDTGIGVVRVVSGDDGGEVQEVEVSVRDEDPAGADTSVDQDSPGHVVLRNKPSPRTSTADLPSHRARQDSGTFVRNSGSRSSWRLVPTATQAARDAAAAKERTELKEKRKSAILTSSTNIGDGDIVFSDPTEELGEERVVTLVQRSEDEPHTLQESGTSVTVLVSAAEVIDGPSNQEDGPSNQNDYPSKQGNDLSNQDNHPSNQED